MTAAPAAPTPTRVLARNVALNVAAHLAPLVAGVALTPYLVGTLGTERFGGLALAAVLIGYMGVFDLGFGRALTKLVAERLASGRHAEVAPLVGTALSFQLGLGVLASAALLVASPWLIDRVLTLPATLRDEATHAVWMIAASVPLAMQSASLQGLLEAQQRFDLTGMVRIGLGPAVAAALGGGLAEATGGILAARIAAWVVYLVLCLTLVPGLCHAWRPHRPALSALLRFGGWLSIANVAGPLIVHADRFVLGAVESMRAVAYFATPYDAVTRIWVLPDAVLAVLFPAFSAGLATDPTRAVFLFRLAAKFLFIALFPLTLALVVLAPVLLDAWLGPEFAAEGSRAMQFIALGVFVNGLARVPFVFLQAAGRPDAIALITLVQLALYPFVSLAAVRAWGLNGAAAAWLLRIVADSLVWSALVARVHPGLARSVGALAAQTGLAVVCIAIAALSATTAWTRVAVVAVVAIAFAIAAWRWGLSEAERASATRWWRTRASAAG
jgi:O-antigen/teichoic acid export membrane protein